MHAVDNINCIFPEFEDEDDKIKEKNPDGNQDSWRFFLSDEISTFNVLHFECA